MVDKFLLKLVLSSLFGAAIGFQRELKDRPAGLRTHTLVSLASCLFTVISLYGIEGGDPTRIVSNVAVGIGFIGAGTIIKQGNIIIGLTTAASLWTVAAIGVLVGASHYELAFFSTLAALLVLVLFKEIEERIGKKRVFEFSFKTFKDAVLPKPAHLQKKILFDQLEFLKEGEDVFVRGRVRFRHEEEIESVLKELEQYGEIVYQKWL
ncbi:MAG: MgtC/SapB family protein [Actinobacteria bacterium]|nr:MgtC/SapB family protein [Actinomycetota bacterium]